MTQVKDLDYNKCGWAGHTLPDLGHEELIVSVRGAEHAALA